jgi:hypothetical protein
MEWNEENFKERVTERARELNKSLRSVLISAGLAHETFQKVPVQGRRVDTLIKLAKALDWTLADIMGWEMIGRVDVELLILSYKTAVRGMRYVSNPTKEAELEVTARIYNVLADRQRAGETIDQNVLDGLAAYVASEWSKNS